MAASTEKVQFTFDYLGCSSLPRGSTGLGSVQRLLRELYFRFRKEIKSRGRPPPDCGRILQVSPGGLSMTWREGSKTTRTVAYSFSDVLWWDVVSFVGLKGHDKKHHRVAFESVQMSPSAAMLSTDHLYTTIDKKHAYLLTLKHPPLFICVLRRPQGLKALDCHVFACPSRESSLHIVTVLHRAQRAETDRTSSSDGARPFRYEPSYRGEPLGLAQQLLRQPDTSAQLRSPETSPQQQLFLQDEHFRAAGPMTPQSSSSGPSHHQNIQSRYEDTDNSRLYTPNRPEEQQHTSRLLAPNSSPVSSSIEEDPSAAISQLFNYLDDCDSVPEHRSEQVRVKPQRPFSYLNAESNQQPEPKPFRLSPSALSGGHSPSHQAGVQPSQRHEPPRSAPVVMAKPPKSPAHNKQEVVDEEFSYVLTRRVVENPLSDPSRVRAAHDPARSRGREAGYQRQQNPHYRQNSPVSKSRQKTPVKYSADGHQVGRTSNNMRGQARSVSTDRLHLQQVEQVPEPSRHHKRSKGRAESRLKPSAGQGEAQMFSFDLMGGRRWKSTSGANLTGENLQASDKKDNSQYVGNYRGKPVAKVPPHVSSGAKVPPHVSQGVFPGKNVGFKVN